MGTINLNLIYHGSQFTKNLGRWGRPERLSVGPGREIRWAGASAVVQVGIKVEFEWPVKCNVRPEQWGQTPPVDGGVHPARPLRFIQDPVDQPGIDQH